MHSVSFDACFQFPFSYTCIFLLIICFVTSIKAQVPTNKIFTFVNRGAFGDEGDFTFIYESEYGATYRPILNDIYSFNSIPFRLCFYNSTPNAYVFAIRAGVPGDQSLLRWVWDANRNNPVRENATLSFGTDGNLALTDVDGRRVWQTNTANKGVTGIKLLSNGNLVLHDKKGKFIWQSFDYPVDTLLVGMAIRKNVNKLVSRASSRDGTHGKYSLILENAGLNLFMNNSGELLKYNGWPGNWGSTVKFVIEAFEQTTYELLLYIYLDSGTNSPLPSRPDGIQTLTKINYNATLTFLRLESDGNIRAYTYFGKTWSESFAFFSNYYEPECRLPSKCGSYGLCENGMCVGCPSPKGLLGWSQSCSPPKLKVSCGAKAKVDYYKMVGVEHFLNGPSINGGIGNFGEGPMKVESCREKCSKDCECKGFIYREDMSMCLIVPVLETLIKNDVNTSNAYIKFSK